MIILTSSHMNHDKDKTWRLVQNETGRVFIAQGTYGEVQELQWALKQPDAYVSEKTNLLRQRILDEQTGVSDVPRSGE